MHYKGHLITKNEPTDKTLKRILSKYYYENNNNNLFEYDWFEIGGRYSKDIQYYNYIEEFDITNCYVVIDDEENLYIREYWDNKKKRFIEDLDFDKKVKSIDLKDKYITIIDFHD